MCCCAHDGNDLLVVEQVAEVMQYSKLSLPLLLSFKTCFFQYQSKRGEHSEEKERNSDVGQV